MSRVPLWVLGGLFWLGIEVGALLPASVPASAWVVGWVGCAAICGRRAVAAVVLAAVAAGATCAASDFSGRVGTAAGESGPVVFTAEVRGTLVRTARGFRVSLEGGDVTTELSAYVRSEDECREPLPGDVVRVSATRRRPRGYATPGVADRGRRAIASGIDWFASADCADIELVDSGGVGVVRLAGRIERRLTMAISKRGESRGAALVRALVTGDRSGLDAELGDSMRRAGVAHLLAVSGLHLGLLVLLCFVVVRRLWCASDRLDAILAGRQVAAVVAISVAVLYTAVTGARPATCRALAVALVYLIGVLVDARPRLLDTIGVAVIALLAIDPSLSRDASFQLSIAAVAIIAAAAPRGFAPLLSLAWWRQLAWVSVWATLATAPIVAHHFGEVPLAGVAGNLLFVPLVALLLLPLSFAAAALSLVSPALGAPLLDLAIAVGDGVAVLVVAFGEWAPVIAVSRPSGTQWALYIGAMAAVLVFARAGARRLRRRSLVAAVVLFAACALSVGWPRTPPNELVVAFVDVGQADAAVVEFPSGAVWLFDAGGQPFVRGARSAAERRHLGASPARHSLLPYLRERRIRRIDVAVLSHPDLDHYLGLWAVADSMPIDRLWITAEVEPVPQPPDYRELLRELRARGTEIIAPPLGTDVSVGTARVTAIAPRYLSSQRASQDPVLDVNDNSLVVRVDYAGRSVLFAGDIEHEGEELLVRASSAQLAVDVVKVPHHGSNTSSTAALVAATRPRYAIISCGFRNRFGFPRPGVERRWMDAGARVLRTDLDGTVIVRVDPTGAMTVETTR